MENRHPVALVGDLTVWLATAGVLAGLLLGALSVSEERYLDHGLTLLLLETMRDHVFGTLFAGAIVLLISTAVFAGARFLWFRFLGARPKRVLWLALYVVALVGVFILVDRSFGARRWWERLGTADRFLILIGVGLAAERVLIPGRIGFVPRRIPRWLAGLFLLVPIGFGLAVPPVRAARVEKVKGKPNFLYLIVDALRADHTGAHGYHRDVTPTLDRMASEGYRFENTVSNSVATRYTVASIHSMVFPSVHRIRKDGHRLSRHFVTAAEHLRDAGYETASWSPNPALKVAFGYAQGFGHYDDQILNEKPDAPMWERFETAQRINTRALEWIRERKDRPWFIYIHYREPHFPYAPPPLYDGIYYKARPDGKPHRPLTPEEIARQPEPGGMVDGDDRNDLEYYVAQYDASIRYFDDQLGLFLKSLRAEGLLDNTVIAVSADHGEGFLEHDNWNHGNVIYDEMLHVPGILRMPDALPQPVVFSEPVHTFDFCRTFLDLAGVEPKGIVQAKSLMPLIRGGQAPWEYAYVEKLERGALRNGKWKYILRRRKDRLEQELYDLEADPGEKSDVIRERAEIAVDLRRKIDVIQRLNEKLAAETTLDEVDLSEEDRRELESLGYL
ncbi:MAG: sulfatase [Planctomycetota bacterium]